MQLLILFELSILLGFLLDILLADLSLMPHPVVMIGKMISFFEKTLRKTMGKTTKGEISGGADG